MCALARSPWSILHRLHSMPRCLTGSVLGPHSPSRSCSPLHASRSKSSSKSSSTAKKQQRPKLFQGSSGGGSVYSSQATFERMAREDLIDIGIPERYFNENEDWYEELENADSDADDVTLLLEPASSSSSSAMFSAAAEWRRQLADTISSSRQGLAAAAQRDGSSTGSKQQQQQQQQPQQQPLNCFVCWDLDNLHPEDWRQLPDVVSRLGELCVVLGGGGDAQVAAAAVTGIRAFANRATLARYVPGPGADRHEFVSEAEELIREVAPMQCSVCGRKFKTLEEVTKHFRQLHEREHNKKAGPHTPKKVKSRYLQSAKAKKYSEAAAMIGLSKVEGGSKHGSRKAQAVKALLGSLGVTAVEVVSRPQAADYSLAEFVNNLKQEIGPCSLLPQLSARPATISSTSSSTGSSSNGGADSSNSNVEGSRESDGLSSSSSSSTAKPGSSNKPTLPGLKQQQHELIHYLRAARTVSRDRLLLQSQLPPLPRWLAAAVNDPAPAAAEPAAVTLVDAAASSATTEELLPLNAGSSSSSDAEAALLQNSIRMLKSAQQAQQSRQASWHKAQQVLAAFASPLESSLLILISDDRGFIYNVIRDWLQDGGAGVVVVTSRPAAEWRAGKWQLSKDRQVLFVDWRQLLL